MIASCKHQHDIRLLFDILQSLRIFVSFYSFSFLLQVIIIVIVIYGDDF